MNIPDLPDTLAAAAFAEGFSSRFIVTVDTEEEFDWDAPIRRDGFGLKAVPALARFQEFCESHGVTLIYLIDYAIAVSPVAADVLGPAVRSGRAELGVHLHPWVNPPFDEDVCNANSFAGNLPEELEARKLQTLTSAIRENFGVSPLIYRAGRYGAGPNTARILKDCGILIDSSVRPRFDYSDSEGPDFGSHPLPPLLARPRAHPSRTTADVGLQRRAAPVWSRDLPENRQTPDRCRHPCSPWTDRANPADAGRRDCQRSDPRDRRGARRRPPFAGFLLSQSLAGCWTYALRADRPGPRYLLRLVEKRVRISPQAQHQSFQRQRYHICSLACLAARAELTRGSPFTALKLDRGL